MLSRILPSCKYQIRVLPTIRLCSNDAINFDNEFEKNHIKIDNFQRTVLAVGSSVVALADPSRGDMIACLGEVTVAEGNHQGCMNLEYINRQLFYNVGQSAAKYMLQKMEQSEEGIRILKDQPRILSKTVNLQKLKTYPEGTLGKAYSTFLEVNNVTPDCRDPVRFVDDKQLAYIIQRYRDVHDLVHTLLFMPTNMLGEVTVKWVEAIQTKLPMCIGGAIFGAVRLRPKQRALYRKFYLPWAIETGQNSEFLLNVYFEERWEQQVSEIYKELNIKMFTGPKTKKLNINYIS